MPPETILHLKMIQSGCIYGHSLDGVSFFSLSTASGANTAVNRKLYQRQANHTVIQMDVMLKVNFGVHSQAHEDQGWSQGDPENDQQCICIAGVGRKRGWCCFFH